jgi:SSS family solute:Na+ symporter
MPKTRSGKIMRRVLGAISNKRRGRRHHPGQPGNLYIIYCFLLGAEGLFHRKNLFGLRHRRPLDPLFRLSDGGHGGLFFRVDLHRPPRPIWRDGLAYAFASFYVLTIPITGTFFSKRTWLLGKRYGFITPGDMYAYYFNTKPSAGWWC